MVLIRLDRDMRTGLLAIISCLYAVPGIAMVGGAPASGDGIARSVVTIVQMA